jgi:hypothetical protein
LTLIAVDMEEKGLRLRTETRLTIREARRSDAAALLEYWEAVSAETDYLTFGPGEFNKELCVNVVSVRPG